ncbi:Crp/Fnr family transcriptional regulator [Prolixibacter sp. SD074]|jgi:CRP-like cAMP-binding protein|uniref:Crp/Fnr family transcriptional regulator n=1 Tax=Prolixibacter sp. SD074 TaxID=2652391 RepID=UPI001282DCF5|nr:Crp/Fnr family transcriptional regulator [Prolixibacter sp. SD074]GET29055.1 transcriptional regulator [Prolixibacter sp. SD074]
MNTVLAQSPIFKELQPLEVENLLVQVPHQIRHFHKDDLLAVAGEEVNAAMIIMEGKLQGEMVDFGGNSLKIEELTPPQMVAAGFLFGRNSRFPVNLSAMADGKMLIILKPNFTRLLSLDNRVLNNFLNIISDKAQFLSRKISFLNFKTIREKIAFFLLQYYKPGFRNIPLPQNQQSLAEMFGVARPSLARTIGELQREGILEWRRSEVEIRNAEALKSILQ